MDKFFLLELPILLCCFRVLSGSFLDRGNAVINIVQCRMCHLQFPGEKCYKGRGTCIATTDEACAVGRIFKKDGTPWLTFLGCIKNCADVKNMRWDVYVVNLSCCRSSDLCNEKL
ncbi:PREDICTED: prostate and testis expressed protein 1 [Galeopterus variegatus]|uniref:Prostate and testis expressed protein 1 n=1 Tax=Galeopterus variegatus TaxID=482537 RepID=A0ABM0S5B3_GALVR|nr:PREDICTED: prostate and testis expressed protein 1 [Galeopterus variegatus]